MKRYFEGIERSGGHEEDNGEYTAKQDGPKWGQGASGGGKERIDEDDGGGIACLSRHGGQSSSCRVVKNRHPDPRSSHR